MYRDTDGYIIIDLKGIDVSRASQSVPGLYEKVEPVLDANKLVIVNNAGNHTPLPGSCIKASNYIRITTDIYFFTINSNNILIIEANGSSITVDVSIIPAYSEGTKIADFEINGQSGELYIPAYPDIINDSVASDHTVYSSDKVNTLLSGKADTSAIPTKTSDLDNDSGFITSSEIPAIPDDLNDLSDVDISSASDAQVLTFDAISGKWVNATSPSGVTKITQLSDVDVTGIIDGDWLIYNSSTQKFEAGASYQVISLAALTDTSISSKQDGQALIYDADSYKWENKFTDSSKVTYDNTSSGLTATRVQAAIDELKGDIITNITDLSDVTITTPASGNALVYDGSEWTNDTLAAADIPYSAGVSVADMLNITDITSSYCTLSTGYSLDANSRVYKQGRHIWGNLLIVASTALPGANDSVNIGTINSAYRTESTINGFCGLSNGQWFTNEIGYVYIAVNGSVAVAAPSTGKTYIKMMIDYCTA